MLFIEEDFDTEYDIEKEIDRIIKLGTWMNKNVTIKCTKEEYEILKKFDNSTDLMYKNCKVILI